MAYKNIDNIIINTACNLFMENGYNNVSVNEICSACSITKPTLYYHFKSKEDILYKYFHALIESSANMVIELKNNSINSAGLPVSVSDDTASEKLNDKNSIYYNGKRLVIEAFNILFSVFTSKGYDMTQAFISACVCDISKALYFPDSISCAITEYIGIGQRDGSILNNSKTNELFDTFCHAFVGYIVYWCQHNGLIDGNNTLKEAILPLFN